MNLPKNEIIRDKSKEIEKDFGAIAANDFVKGAEWMLQKIKRINNPKIL
jgi:hypothetical protein